MNKSVSLYWRNSTGVEPPEFYDGMGMAIFDWAHGSEQWANPEDGGPSDNGGVLAKQCAVIKKRQGKDFRCIVYRNTVIALNQFRHVSRILDDPQYAGYFLKFKRGATQATKADGSPDCWGIADPRAQGCTDTSCKNCDVIGRRPGCNDPLWPTPAVCKVGKPSDVHVPMCDKADPTKCSTELYFDQNQCAQVPGDNWSNDTKDVYQGLICNGKTCNCGKLPCGEYLFDFRNDSLVEWYLKTHMGGPTALGHPDVDGLILDDYWSGGPSEIDSHSLLDMGLSPAEAGAVRNAYGVALNKLLAYIPAQNKSLPGGRPMAYGGDMMSTQDPPSCKAKLDSMCGSNDGIPRPGACSAVRSNSTASVRRESRQLRARRGVFPAHPRAVRVGRGRPDARLAHEPLVRGKQDQAHQLSPRSPPTGIQRRLRRAHGQLHADRTRCIRSPLDQGDCGSRL